MIVGVDEAGRGALAGPVTVGAVATPAVEPIWWRRVRDSKKMTPRAREEVFGLLEAHGVPHAVGSATHVEIDQVGIERAVVLAAMRALKALESAYDLGGMIGWDIVVDGDDGWGLGRPVVGGDDKVREIGAASICAKVVRDFWMSAQVSGDAEPYGFPVHKGYGTAAHMDALARLGPCGLHRMSFRPCAEASRGAVRAKSGSETPVGSTES